MRLNSFRRACYVGMLLSMMTACGVSNVASERVILTTPLGEIEIELYAEQAPISVANFLQYVDGGHLDGATFYRVVSPDNDNGSPVISVIQGGIGNAPSPFAPIAHETTEQTGLRHVDGTISMARGAVGTAASEFFICIDDQPALDFGALRNPDGQGFAAFGRVIAGMHVVRAIHNEPADAPTSDEYVSGQIIEEPIMIRSARRR